MYSWNKADRHSDSEAWGQYLPGDEDIRGSYNDLWRLHIEPSCSGGDENHVHFIAPRSKKPRSVERQDMGGTCVISDQGGAHHQYLGISAVSLAMAPSEVRCHYATRLRIRSMTAAAQLLPDANACSRERSFLREAT